MFRDNRDEKYATLKEAIHDIGWHNYEQSASQGGGKYCCLKCGKNLKGEYYWHQFNYPYINVKLWKMCEKCFKQIKKQVEKKKELCKTEK